LRQLSGRDLTFHLGQIGLRDLEQGVHHAVNQGAIVGQQQQAFRIIIQSAGAIDVGYPDIVGQGRSATIIGKLG